MHNLAAHAKACVAVLLDAMRTDRAGCQIAREKVCTCMIKYKTEEEHTMLWTVSKLALRPVTAPGKS